MLRNFPFVFMLFNLQKSELSTKIKGKSKIINRPKSTNLSIEPKIIYLEKKIENFSKEFYQSSEIKLYLLKKFYNGKRFSKNFFNFALNIKYWITTPIKKYLTEKNLLRYKTYVFFMYDSSDDNKKCSRKSHKNFYDDNLIMEIYCRNYFSNLDNLMNLRKKIFENLDITYVKTMDNCIQNIIIGQFIEILISGQYINYCICCILDD